jgi:hypothetical protein
MFKYVFIAAGLTALGAQQSKAAESICGVPFASPAQVEGVVSKAKGVVSIKGNDYIHGYSNPQSSVAWIFTSKKSSAHPAVVCRWQSAKNGKPVFLTDIRCGGKKNACEKLAAEYRRLDSVADAAIKQIDKQIAKKKSQ